jgi:hypothetical protein
VASRTKIEIGTFLAFESFSDKRELVASIASYSSPNSWFVRIIILVMRSSEIGVHKVSEKSWEIVLSFFFFRIILVMGSSESGVHELSEKSGETVLSLFFFGTLFGAHFFHHFLGEFHHHERSSLFEFIHFFFTFFHFLFLFFSGGLVSEICFQKFLDFRHVFFQFFLRFLHNLAQFFVIFAVFHEFCSHFVEFFSSLLFSFLFGF